MSAIRLLHDGSLRLRSVAAVGIIFSLAILVLVVDGNDKMPPVPEPVVVQDGQLTIESPERIAAGEGFSIDVDGLEAGHEVLTMVETGYQVHTISTVPTGGRIEISVPPFDGPASGTTLITVVQEDRVVQAGLEIEPGAATSPIDVYLGPRTVIADTAHFAMIVAVPTDRFGNPVASGTVVDFTTTRPDLKVEGESRETASLLSWYEVFSRSVTGRTRVATESGGAGAAEQTFLEVAGIPTDYGLELIDPILPADGSALLRINTDLLADEYANLLPDGTAATLHVRGVTGPRSIAGQTIDGRAAFTLEVPDRPGDIVLTATASGVRSAPLTLTFESAVNTVEAEYEELPDLAVVHIGPVRSVRGSFVPEGTVALVTAADGTATTAELSLGIGDATFPLDTDLSSISVEVLGTTTILRPER